MFTYIYVCMYVTCIYIYTYIHIYICIIIYDKYILYIYTYVVTYIYLYNLIYTFIKHDATSISYSSYNSFPSGDPSRSPWRLLVSGPQRRQLLPERGQLLPRVLQTRFRGIILALEFFEKMARKWMERLWFPGFPEGHDWK